MNFGSEWKWRLLDAFAQGKDDVEMWVDAPGRSLSSPPKPSLNDPNGNAPKHHGLLARLPLRQPLVGFVDASGTAMSLKRTQAFHQPQSCDEIVKISPTTPSALTFVLSRLPRHTDSVPLSYRPT